MNILDRLLGGKESPADALSIAQDKIASAEKRLSENSIAQDKIADAIEAAELAVGLGEGSAKEVNTLRADLADLETEAAALAKAIDQLRAKLPGIEEQVAEEKRRLEVEAIKASAQTSQKTIGKRLDAVEKAKADLDKAITALSDVPAAKYAAESGQDMDTVRSQAKRELAALAEFGQPFYEIEAEAQREAEQRESNERAARQRAETERRKNESRFDERAHEDMVKSPPAFVAPGRAVDPRVAF